MESSMHGTRGRTPRLLVLVFALVLGLGVTGAANAEFPTVRGHPSILGTPQEGQTLDGRKGQWLMNDGLNCTDCTFSWTWQRCAADGSGCTDVPSRTGFTYLLGAEDVGKRIRLVEWVFKRDCGEINYSNGTQECADITKNQPSAMTEVVQPKPVTIAQASAPPTIQGLAMEEEVLRATGGTWTGPGTITKVIYWQRCNAVGEGCATIVGATGPTYRLTAADVGSRVRVVETASNEGGVAQAVSTASAVVVELRPSATRPTIAAAKIAQPHRLNLRQVTVRQVGRRVTIQVPVWDTRGFKVIGVRVALTPTGLLAGSGRERATNGAGMATFTFTATGSGSTYVYVEARKAGERAQSGVWTAKLFKIRVR
jgi:hypothetical protein